MFRKIAGIVCVIISILYFFNATHSIEDPYNHYIELFHPKGIVDVLVQYLELIPFVILALYFKTNKLKINLSKHIYGLFIVISFILAMLFTTNEQVKVNIIDFFIKQKGTVINVRTAAILVLWILNGIILFSIAIETSKDKTISQKLFGFRILLIFSAVAWISIKWSEFFQVLYSLSIAFLGGFFIIENPEKEKKLKEAREKEINENMQKENLKKEEKIKEDMEKIKQDINGNTK